MKPSIPLRLILQPLPFLCLNTPLIVTQPEIPEVILEAKPHIPAFGLRQEGIVLVEVAGSKAGVGFDENSA